jgi:hypothetical protein
MESDSPGPRVAAVLRLQWWRGEKTVIVGEGYAEAVDKYFTGMDNRQRAMLLRELKKWWIEYRTQSGN